MTRLFTISSALALAVAAPAVAQQAEPMMTPPAPEAPMPNEMPAPTETPAPMERAATPVEPSAQAAPADARVATVTQLVEAEFPTYDVDNNGDLTQPEFTKWVLALHSKAEEAKAATKMDEAAKAKWAKNAFATADTDKSKKVSKAELTTFLLA